MWTSEFITQKVMSSRAVSVIGTEVSVGRRKLTTTGKIVLGVSGAVCVGLVAVTSPFLSPALRRVCLPYVPATPTQISNVLAGLKGRRGSVLDIGSGDGRIVLEAAKHGFKGYGVELNFWLVLYSRYQAWKQGQKGAKFYRKDLWKTNLSVYDNIIIFGVETMMDQLETKFDKELTRDSHVVVCRFPLPNWHPVRTYGHGIDAVWVYKHPSNTDYTRIAKPVINSDGVVIENHHEQTINFSTKEFKMDNQSVEKESTRSLSGER